MSSRNKLCVLFVFVSLAASAYGWSDFDEAMARVSVLLRDAKSGNVQAQYELGYAYETGRGVAPYQDEAFKWYSEAAKRNHPKAKFRLGRFYFYGNYVQQDYAKAAKLWLEVPEELDANALYLLGNMYANGNGVKKNYEEAMKYLKQSANKNYVHAQYDLGLIYDGGYYEISPDKAEAFKWYSKAAEQGLADALNKLGIMYSKGEGTEQDYDKAVKYFVKAIMQTNRKMQFIGNFQNAASIAKKGGKKGMLYAINAASTAKKGWKNAMSTAKKNGKSVINSNYIVRKNSREEALENLTNLASAENAKAQLAVGMLYYNGDGVGQGYADAQFCLGKMYSDKDKAAKWLRKAAQQNHKEAQKALQDMGETW